jgi:hypothetical protein
VVDDIFVGCAMDVSAGGVHPGGIVAGHASRARRAGFAHVARHMLIERTDCVCASGIGA